jgi:hypothetical protein
VGWDTKRKGKAESCLAADAGDCFLCNGVCDAASATGYRMQMLRIDVSNSSAATLTVDSLVGALRQ